VVPSSHARTGFGAQKKYEYWLSQSPKENGLCKPHSHLAPKPPWAKVPKVQLYCNRQGATRFREEVLLYLTTVVPPYILQKESYQLPRQVIQFKTQTVFNLPRICQEFATKRLVVGRNWRAFSQCLHIFFLMVSCGAA